MTADAGSDFALGLVCCLVAGIGFGSNYLPVKQVNVGDGVWFSACMAIGILLVGVTVNFTLAGEHLPLYPHDGPQFEWKAAVGGALWMCGNFLCPIIVRRLGLGLGLAVWDCANLLTGWATGAFGLFGVWAEKVASPTMNYTGVALAMVSLVLLAFATDEEQPEAAGSEAAADVKDGNRSPRSMETGSTSSKVAEPSAKPKSLNAPMSALIASFDNPHGRIVGGFGLSLFTGFLFGLTFAWPTDLIQQGKAGEALDGHQHSDFPMDYVFSHFMGIVGMGAAVLVAYLVKMEGNAFTPRNVVLPGIGSGVLWGIAQVAWFQANQELSLVIAFPIISTLPGIVGCMLGYLFFGEFKGKRSRRLVLVSMCIRIPAVALIALSGMIEVSIFDWM